MMFSERYGFKKKKVFQKESMNKDLRINIFNVIYDIILNNDDYYLWNIRDNITKSISIKVCKKPLNTLPNDVFFFQDLLLKEAKWNEVYDVIEIICSIINSTDIGFSKYIEKRFNSVLQMENSAYRIIDNCVTPIVEDCEINEINKVLNCKYDVVKNQIKDALTLLSDRKNPNYKDSFKNSISAVESLCKIILKSENISLGKALKQIEKNKKIKLNGTLKKVYSTLYGFASNEVRHGTIKEPEIDYDLAKYMVVSCSAFINYLISKM